MKIVFLDLDGVLNLIPQGHDEFGAIFHQHFVDNLKRLIDETDAKIVITSTWRFAGLDEMQRMWEFRNLPGEVIDITPDFMCETGSILQRGKEIDQWLSEHKEVTNYVILDDDTDMEPHQMNNFVLTFENVEDIDCVDLGYGLTDNCTIKAINILNKFP